MACKKTSFESGFTFEKLQALEAAIADGVLRVKYSDKEVTYQSMDDMLKARYLMRRKLGVGSKGTGIFGGRRIKAKHSKGLDC